MAINLIVASSQNGVIGKDGKMPWNLPEDLKRFKEITDGSIVIMGRKTFESIGKPLSNRYNFVISKNENYLPGVFCFNSVDSAIDGAIRWFPEYDIFVIGGASIYQQFLERGIVNRIYQTLIKKDFEGDTFFNFDKENWKIIERQDSDECSYITWEKNQ